MFTGIVQERLTVVAIIHQDITTVTLTKPQWGDIAIGESILLHGICSTVTAVTANNFTVDYMSETLAKTTVSDWHVGMEIHAEPSATLQTKLSGNLVYGHVDGTAEVVASKSLTLKLTADLLPYVVLKGAVTVNGVNLTITDIQSPLLTIQLIPHTTKVTTLTSLVPGQCVNIELDYLTKVIVQTVLAKTLAD